MFYSRENIPEGVANAWDHTCITSQTLPALPHVKAAAREVSKVCKTSTRLSYLPQDTELSSFPMISMDQVTCGFANSVNIMSTRNLVDMQRKGKHCAVHTNSKLARKKERRSCTFSNSQVYIVWNRFLYFLYPLFQKIIML